MTDHPPADWYADPEDPTQLRYWDGTAWTEHRIPAPPPDPRAPSYVPSYGGAPVGASAHAPVTSGPAIAALVMGLVSVVACLGPITGIPAIIVGRRAARDIDAAQGALDGRGLATAGVVTGIIGTLIWGLVAVFLVVALLAFSGDSSA